MSKQRAAYMLERYHKKRKALIQALGGVCVICGTSKNLQFHHKNPKDKTVDVSKSWDTLKVKDEILTKCQLLCAVCHKRKHAAKHGSCSMYRHHHCRCVPCKQAWNMATKCWKLKMKNAGSNPAP